MDGEGKLSVRQGSSSTTTSSVEDALQELLSLTSNAVKKLTESHPPGQSAAQSGVLEAEQSKTGEPHDDLMSHYQNDKRLLEILSETQKSDVREDAHRMEERTIEQVDDAHDKTDGRVVDITAVLEEEDRSEVSILDVAGGQPETMSSISTPSTISHEIAKASEPMTIPSFPDAGNVLQDVGGLPGDSILSPILFPQSKEKSSRKNLGENDASFSPDLQTMKEKHLTSSVKLNINEPQDLLENISSASGVLKQSTRAPKIPDSARIFTTDNPKVTVEAKLTSVEVKGPNTDASAGFGPTKIIIRKSNHVEQTQSQKEAPHPNHGDRARDEAQVRVRLPKKRLREVRNPAKTRSSPPLTLNHMDSRMAPVKQMTKSLAQGVEVDEKENQGIGLDSELNIIRSDKEAVKKRLLGAKGARMQPSKRIVTANIVQREKPAGKHPDGDSASMATAVATAMATAAPMLQVKQDLESQVRRLTEKLDELEKQRQLEEAGKHQERAAELEKRLEKLTAQRLRSLEQLQENQAAWQSHFLKVVGNIQQSQEKLSSAAGDTLRHDYPRSVRFNEATGGRIPNVLQTPAPRTQAPYPTTTVSQRGGIQGRSPGNGQLLQNILDQMDVSTPGPSPAIPAHLRLLRDPLAEVTPVRGPSGVAEKAPKAGETAANMTSTPQTVHETRAAILQARKDAEKEAERMEIMRRFPASISQYMVQMDGAVAGGIDVASNKGQETDKPAPAGSSVDGLWKVLEELQAKRKYLDDNLEAVERGRGREAIAAKVDFEILSKHPNADPDAVEKLRIRKMVDEQIKDLHEQIKREVDRELPRPLIGAKRGSTKPVGPGQGKLPRARAGARVDTGLRRQTPFGAAPRGGNGGRDPPKIGPRSSSADQRGVARKRSPSPRDKSMLGEVVCADDEEFVTHVYGRADYHPRRTTVHNPYIHVKTPIKEPNFRKKQAVEVVKANLIRSAKTQTSPSATSRQSQYYFSPTASPVRPPISVSPTPGQLIPMAIPLGAPRLTDGGDPAPLLIHQTDPRFVTLTTTSPERLKKTIRIYDPNSHPSPKRPNAAVITVTGEDGPDLAVQKLQNIDIDTPDVSEATVHPIPHPPVDGDDLPGSSFMHHHDQDESEGGDGSLHIELRGQAPSEVRLDYHGPAFPPAAPPQSTLRASDIADEIDKHEVEDEAIRWVEQEIMARILSEMYPPGAQRIQDSGPVRDCVPEETGEDQERVLLNPESLQLFIDAGLPIDAATMNRLVEEEISAILRDMIRQFSQERATRPKVPVTSAPTPVQRSAASYKVPTPLPTPEPSPDSSVSERPIPHLHTPSLTPESSMAESLPTQERSPEPSPKTRTPTPEVLSPPKTPEEVTLIQTPAATPPATPTPEPESPGTPVLSESSESVPPPRTPPKRFPDPWGGAEFPLPEELQTGKHISGATFAPPPDAVDLVVRELTPPPASPPEQSELSDSETPTTSSSEDHPDGSISEGQLVISHGEMRPKTKPGRLPGIIEELFGDEDVERSIAFQSTLRDANELQNEDYDPYSDGEIRLSMRPSMIARVSQPRSGGRKSDVPSPEGDDPAGIYTRPRHPLPSEDEGEDLSVGEVKPKTIMSRKNKFKRWREERSPKYASKKKEGAKQSPSVNKHLPGSPLSMGDLHKPDQSSEADSYTDLSQGASGVDSDRSYGQNVIVVAPSGSKQTTPKPLTGTQFGQEEGKQQSDVGPPQPGVSTLGTTGASMDMEYTGASTDQSAVIKDSLDESMRKRNDLGGTFFEDEAGPPVQTPLKVSLTLPSVEHVVSVSSEPVTDDVSEISTAGF